jgi:hypothetical protein
MHNKHSLSEENKEMLRNQAIELIHHADELMSVLEKSEYIEPWVLAKAERATTDLSDITHYLDGHTEEMHDTDKLEDGGKVYVDLFEDYENMPKEVSIIYNDYQERYGEDMGYKEVQEMLSDMENVGYIFDYGLDGVPYGLRPMGVDLNELRDYDEYSDGGYMKKGGALEIYDVDKSYRVGRPNNAMEKDILDRVSRYSSSDENFVGNFGWKTPQGTRAEGYLYKLDDYNQSLVRDIKLKEGEKIFRYFNRTSAIGGMTPMIKINLNSELIYFSLDTPDDSIAFTSRGTQALYINLIKGKYAKGGYMS